MAFGSTLIDVDPTGVYYELQWEATQTSEDKALNRSRVTYNSWIGSPQAFISSGAKSANVTVDGVSTNFTTTIGTYTSGGWRKPVIVNNARYVYHNSSGAKNLAISSWVDVNVTMPNGAYIGRLSVEELSAPLEPIPKRSAFSSTPTGTTGSTWSFSITPASSAYNHEVILKLGSSRTASTTLAAGVSSGSITIPASWANAITNSTSSTMAATLVTKSGTWELGRISKSLKLNVNSSVVPSVGAITETRINGKVPSAWNSYVQGESQAKFAVSPSGSYGSTITNITFTLDGVTRSYGNTSASTTFPLPKAGSRSVGVTVTDSRGRKASASKTFTVLAYSKPRFLDNAQSVKRADSSGVEVDNGTYAKIGAGYSYSTVSMKNSLATRIRYRVSGASAWTTPGWTLASSGSTAIRRPVGGFLIDQVYDIELSITDALGNGATWVTRMSSEFVTMDFLKGGHGVAFGKVASQPDVLDVDWMISARKGFVRQQLPPGANLNDYSVPGMWHEPSSVAAENLVNRCPSKLAGALEVVPTTGSGVAATGVIQYWHDYGAGDRSGLTWRRIFYAGSWSDWEMYAGRYRGGNSSNGWILYPGGVQYAWYNVTVSQAINGTYGGIFVGTHTWTFANAFSSPPTVAVGSFLWGTSGSWGSCFSVSKTAAGLRGHDMISRAAGNTQIRAIAIGYADI